MKLRDFDRELVAKEIERFINEKFEDSGSDKLIIGLSGGIDSSVTSALCKNAVGSENVLGISLPINESSNRPQKIANQLGIDFEEIDIEDSFLSTLKVLETKCSHFSDKKVSLGNMKARLRMVFLYYHANSLNGLVVGTGNKSEMQIGYFTKYGDGAADLFPIGDLYKTQVKEMAKYLNIPEQIIEKKPSASLWEGQTDEKEIGYSYSKLDQILMELDTKEEVDDIRDEFGEEAVNDVLEMKKRSNHKRKKPPICEIS
ncbi:NAD(+) synthetase [archaeon SCG-AAA382B04]|nr:NAD(+) synthetase [archaeon SCG-AAA382B04]